MIYRTIISTVITVAVCWLSACQTNQQARQTAHVLPTIVQSATAGAYVTIKGHGFSANAADIKVTFGNVEATIISASATQLLVKVPAIGKGTVRVTVTVNDQVSDVALFNCTAVPALAYSAAF
ncbi:IPT/TIG domain-containing protein [Chitinophaga pendula]|uniref:IPT/TIG domain-containing protein n=1 Tax=Chitinophaga TaxID=79328 RepID=UPI000BB052FA|nr:MULTISPECIES: IPT/TIG domain-containing protein [Chitinophaga]ASZ10457.1 hypothetical protein CK934_05440 [Chitinophaga sp. MD30]UCJ06572.1 IPT/TIG domain-containing protein [Chitinophaga pendula]